MQTHSSGWRRLPRALPPSPPIDDIAVKDLYAVARLAARALNLRPSERQILDQLVGCWGGEALKGRVLVWPSNEFLVERTGLSERAVRYAVAGLVRAGVIASRDSANGKRFAIRSKSGQILDAFGLDLAPLIARRQEFEGQVEAGKIASERRSRMFDEITISRRATMEALRATAEWFPQTATDDLESEFERLMKLTPRRSSKASPDASLAAWRALREAAEARYSAACGGNNCRLIEDNNDAPDQSCNKRQGMNEAEPALPALVELAAACPDALGYAENVREVRDLIREAGRLRGAFGTHESAWYEALERLGAARAAHTFFLVLQLYSEDGGKRIKNFGGYFRSYVRLVDAGSVDVGEEVRGMRRRRAH